MAITPWGARSPHPRLRAPHRPRDTEATPKAVGAQGARVAAEPSGGHLVSEQAGTRRQAMGRPSRHAHRLEGHQPDRARPSTSLILTQPEQAADRLVNDPGHHGIPEGDSVAQRAGKFGNEGGPRRRVCRRELELPRPRARRLGPRWAHAFRGAAIRRLAPHKARGKLRLATARHRKFVLGRRHSLRRGGRPNGRPSQ